MRMSKARLGTVKGGLKWMHVSALDPPGGRLVSIHVDVWMNATGHSTWARRSTGSRGWQWEATRWQNTHRATADQH